jgi:hypothetical protein
MLIEVGRESQLVVVRVSVCVARCETRGTKVAILLLALLVLILFGAGFAIHLLWIAAVVLAIVWVASFALGRGEGASRRSLRR